MTGKASSKQKSVLNEIGRKFNALRPNDEMASFANKVYLAGLSLAAIPAVIMLSTLSENGRLPSLAQPDESTSTHSRRFLPPTQGEDMPAYPNLVHEPYYKTHEPVDP